MRPRLVPAIVAVLAVAACGGTTTPVAAPADTSPTVTASATATSTPAPTSADTSVASCGTLTKADLERFALMAQLFPQLTNDNALNAVRDGAVVDYDPESFAAILARMEFLRGRPAPIGDPGASLDYYAGVNDALAELLAVPEPTQADFDAYLAVVGDVGSSIAKQAGITTALDEACPDLL